ncbi:hypothetical protein LXL04_007636 [Taraxacum kok-saghyz]
MFLQTFYSQDTRWIFFLILNIPRRQRNDRLLRVDSSLPVRNPSKLCLSHTKLLTSQSWLLHLLFQSSSLVLRNAYQVFDKMHLQSLLLLLPMKHNHLNLPSVISALMLLDLQVDILCETRLKRGNYIQFATKGFVPKMRRTRSSSRLGSTLKSKFTNDPKNALEVDGDDDFVSPPTARKL